MKMFSRCSWRYCKYIIINICWAFNMPYVNICNVFLLVPFLKFYLNPLNILSLPTLDILYIKTKKFGYKKFQTIVCAKVITSKILCCPKFGTSENSKTEKFLASMKIKKMRAWIYQLGAQANWFFFILDLSC